ncbi:COX15/CtaA family protein [Marivirga sp. S37H4]|uniref:COX15/CtaA family protein n=1 Tax=Marivirga aurantiaca TaxID=2802615 RepID=A0A934WVC2_9BACT|nr:COX15/CtaA family protein [Marivirga aurantiaca]MBK6263718.1 COX15/CtaA family protein [Marivirga aurantiaca]
MQRQQNLNNEKYIGSYYSKLTTVTLVAVYLLILAGGIVRSTGSGMGCPDWPKCFGSWVPPTEVGQLPEDYQEFYADYRHQKNIKFAEYLDFFGYADIGEAILADESIKEEAEFNKYKTWTEYVNRLLGALVGFLIILCFIGSIKYFSTNRKLFWLSFSSLILVLIQGWIGSIVVSTNLLSWLITLHMILALVILAVLTALYFYSANKVAPGKIKQSGKLKVLLIIGLFFMLLQIVFGTQVRESLDMVAERLGQSQRDSWIAGLGLQFYIHRSFSILIAIYHFYLFYVLLQSNPKHQKLVFHTKVLISFILIEILSGAVMAYFGVPFWVQPLHLVLGSLIFGWQFYLLLQVSFMDKKVNTSAYAIS